MDIDDIRNKLSAKKKPTKASLLLPHLGDITQLKAEGYPLSLIAQEYGMTPKEFYAALKRAKNIKAKQEKLKTIEKANLCAEKEEQVIAKNNSAHHGSEEISNLQSPYNPSQSKEADSIKQQEDENISWKERIERSVKPSNYLHRFNVDIEHQ